MSSNEIDEYLDGLDEPKRSTLAQLRHDILAVVPDAEQCLSYAVPAFKVAGKTVAGFAAFKNHLSYLPHSGSVFAELAEELAGYRRSSGALRFATDERCPHPWWSSSSRCGCDKPFPRAMVRVDRDLHH